MAALVTEDRNVTAWLDLKKTLADTSPWVGKFFVALDDAVSKRLAGIRISAPPPYEPQLLEDLLNDITELLDRALLYRRDANDLEVLAVRHAVDFKLFLDSDPLDTELAELVLSSDQSQVQATMNAEAAGHFAAAATADPLAAGLRSQADGLSQAAGLTLAKEERRKALIRQKAELVRQYQHDMNTRHTTPGNAHNFGERYERVMALLLDDVEEAYVKVQCVALGLKSVLGLDLPVPAVAGRSYLDALVRWARAAMREASRTMYSECEFDFVVSAVSGSPVTGMAQYDRASMAAAMASEANGTFGLDLSAEFSGFSHLRTKGIGLSIGFPLSATSLDRDHARLFRVRSVINPPQQRNDLAATGYHRLPIIIGYAGSLYTDNPPQMEEAFHVKNIDPRGTWTIKVDPTVHGPDLSVGKRTENIVGDVRLHLRLAGRPL